MVLDVNEAKAVEGVLPLVPVAAATTNSVRGVTLVVVVPVSAIECKVISLPDASVPDERSMQGRVPPDRVMVKVPVLDEVALPVVPLAQRASTVAPDKAAPVDVTPVMLSPLDDEPLPPQATMSKVAAPTLPRLAARSVNCFEIVSLITSSSVD